ncbi:MAG TPA: hypothetical protein VGS28_03415 [Candidatus Saccharimonadales bacterium]|nr:hypothetical protein [Candidatus Saccharimonadales bacterium]
MSFLGSLGKIVQGKPVYDTNPPQQNPTDGPTNQPQPGAPAPVPGALPPVIQRDNPATFPVVFIRNTLTRPNGNDVQVYCFIHNNWHDAIRVKKIRIFDRETEVDYELSPGQEREVLVYQGPAPQQKFEQAFLDYETVTPGGYFEAMHLVQYIYHDDSKTYQVDRMQLHQPIRCVSTS